MSWPRTVAGKIEEGEFKVRTIEHVGKDTEREIEALMRQMEFMEAEMEFEVKLDGYCCDVEDMRKARQEYRAKSLSEAEERSLRQIRDLAASAIADFETRGSPVPDYHGPINVFSDTIPFELPLPLFNALKSSAPSHQKLSRWPGMGLMLPPTALLARAPLWTPSFAARLLLCVGGTVRFFAIATFGPLLSRSSFLCLIKLVTWRDTRSKRRTCIWCSLTWRRPTIRYREMSCGGP
ncbi:uncharacterized protein LOC100841003 isoform X1 [Brachypodium distachyon]|uniref:Uncharacterized protein n=1 Tax=Brachypodium distachyon TaxID=15368 RepID=A0A2K2CID1_BRADI|nr:uncharacterized protein LOC100841003 isoform X1 [Brachypodium distachyon]XP_024312108.1 uncharacterized protein LOC100841003 isoform X1 [Brachypodium distachyon]PNT61775.1 hypothetical protein BRADI_5g20461v3 [Brachypodium distachyon]|eukprot:XP_024312107.1 uncharacterized protein LOC100841003 isoform X1 [Brachypodium distachyon]